LAKAQQLAHIYFLQLKPSHAIRSEVFAFVVVSTLLDQIPFDLASRLAHGSVFSVQRSLAVLSEVAGGRGTAKEIRHLR
jgi:hypothetical protein